jgi:hypothetical protein
MNRHIIPVLATNEGAPIVLEVKKHGSRPLDLRLIGCEGENVYVTTSKVISISASSLLNMSASQTTRYRKLEEERKQRRMGDYHISFSSSKPA